MAKSVCSTYYCPLAMVLLLAAGAFAVPDLDNAAEMQAELAKNIVSRGSFSMFDEETGKPQPGNSMVMIPDPINENLLYVGVFKKGVMPSSWTRQSSGLTEPIEVCDFCNPSACKNEVPYPGSTQGPDGYQCGVSDEEIPEAGYTCNSLDVPKDDDGDIAFVGTIERPCPCDSDDGEDEASRRRLLALGRFGRALLRRSDSRTRRNRQTHNRRGRVSGSSIVR